jgi:CheY-like chemotaxis protein
MVVNMVKIMLVEDDKSLREIYGVRLLAEGYDIVSAGDGEEALAMAIKERPQLIISDVMMPKISGFDMLDILRSTTETKSIKVIMMTALSSEEQRARGESLGADKYLVKSQVGIEDVVKVVHEVLGDQLAAASAVPLSAPTASQAPAPTAAPSAPRAANFTAPISAPVRPAAPVFTTPAPNQTATIPGPVNTAQNSQPPATQTSTDFAPPSPKPADPLPPSGRNRVIQPINDPRTSPIDINDLLNKELSKESNDTNGVIPTTAEEKESLDDQINQFERSTLEGSPTPSNSSSETKSYTTPLFPGQQNTLTSRPPSGNPTSPPMPQPSQLNVPPRYDNKASAPQ